MNIKFEKEVCAYLNLPKLPVKEWDGESAFDKGVAIIKLAFNETAYAVARFNPEKEKAPSITKVFGQEPFYGIEKVFIVPDYMETNVEDADLDEESKKKAAELANEAAEIENDGTKAHIDLPDNPYYFDNITNDEEAIAFIAAYNQKNGIRGQVPKKHETILNRLLVIYMEQRKAAGVDDAPAGAQDDANAETETEHQEPANTAAPEDETEGTQDEQGGDTQEPAAGGEDENGNGE